MINKQRVKELLDRFELSAIAMSWKGSQPVETREEITEEYHESKRELYNALGIRYERR